VAGSYGEDEGYGGGVEATVNGVDGNDTVRGESGHEIINGGRGNEFLGGGDGNDTLDAGEGRDELYGENGNDILRGGSGVDSLYGGDGDDTLYGGSHADKLTGGDGADTFVFETISDYAPRRSFDLVMDYYVSDGDILDISDLLSGYTAGVDNINDFAYFIGSRSTSILAVDPDGRGQGTEGLYAVAKLYGTAGDLVGIDMQTMIDNGTLIV